MEPILSRVILSIGLVQNISQVIRFTRVIFILVAGLHASMFGRTFESFRDLVRRDHSFEEHRSQLALALSCSPLPSPYPSFCLRSPAPRARRT